MNASRNIAQTIKPFLLCSLLAMAGLAMAADKNDETRAKVRTQSEQVLARLYAAQPGARQVIASSRGYATFSRWGLKLGIIGGGLGKGLLVAKPSGHETFMRFVEGSAGFGFGLKKFDLIFVFQNEKTMADFTKGWEAGGDATMAAKSDAHGKTIEGAVAVAPGVWVYQNTEKGLAAELGIKGTKYYKDDALN
ncbi:lipid-binding SYLF domain-containing protein [Lysobacter sp. P5_B9]